MLTWVFKGEKIVFVIPVGSGAVLSISPNGYVAFLNFLRAWWGLGSPWSLIWLLGAPSLASRQGLGRVENTEPGFLCFIEN